ncbi:reverse transcriptase domain-containing protein [Tanacetum coccineum]
MNLTEVLRDPTSIDDLDDTINIETHELLDNDQLDPFLLNGLEKLINQLELKSCNSVRDEFDNNSDVDLSIRRIDPVNTPYSEAQETEGTDRVLEKCKGAKDLVAYHLSRLENPHMEVLSEREIVDELPDKHLMLLKSKFNDDEPWFGVPKALISDRGTHFCTSHLEKALQKYGVTHKLSMTYHPQSNGQTEVTNRAIKRMLERSVGYNPKDWLEKLNDALWAFRTAYKTLTWCTPFRLVYGKACHLPIEIEHKAHWTKKWHDSKLRGDKDFKVGNKVLLYNSRLKMYPGKLKSKWRGLNIVKKVYPYGAIEIIDRNGFNFKVNGQRLKKYYKGNIDEEDDEVIEFKNGLT